MNRKASRMLTHFLALKPKRNQYGRKRGKITDLEFDMILPPHDFAVSS